MVHPGTLIEDDLRIPLRAPYDSLSVLAYLRARTVRGIEAVDGNRYVRSMRLTHGSGRFEVHTFGARHLGVKMRVPSGDRLEATQRVCSMFDLDADPSAIARVLARDPLLAASVRRRRGVRVAGTVDGFELAVRAILGQQVSVAGAHTLAGRIVAKYGKPLAAPQGAVTHLFPRAEELAEAELSGLGLTGARSTAIRAVARALADGTLALDPSADFSRASQTLLAIPGIGPWTVSYIAMRALRDPDAFPLSDLGIRRAFERAGLPADSASISARAEAWRPWRAYATLHLWMSAND